MLFWFSYSHQLFLSFIVGTFKDSNISCLNFFCYALPFRKLILFTALMITSMLMILNPSCPNPILVFFLSSSFNAYLTIYTFFIIHMISKFSGITFQMKMYLYFCPLLLKYPRWSFVDYSRNKIKEGKKRIWKRKIKTCIVTNLQFYLLGLLYLLCQWCQCFPVGTKKNSQSYCQYNWEKV